MDFLPVPHPTLTLLLAPPSSADGPAAVSALNHASVYMNLNGPPYPYTPADAASWFSKLEGDATTARAHWHAAIADREEHGVSVDEAGRNWRGRKWVGPFLPWTAITLVDGDGGGNERRRFIGEITVRKSGLGWVAEGEGRERCKQVNDERVAGDPETVYEIGYYLAPAHHRQGVMPAVLRTVIHEFMVPWMNARAVYATYFDFNPASRKVMEKCGFEFVTMVAGAVELAESKTGVQGRTCGLGVMRWKNGSLGVS